MKVTETTTQQRFYRLLLLLRMTLKYIVICASIFLTTLSHAEKAEHPGINGWTIGAGVSLSKGEEANYGYLQGELSRHFENGFLFGGEAAFSVVNNKEENIDGSVFLDQYFGISAGYQHPISESLSGTLKFLVGMAMTEEASVDGDSYGVCRCQDTIFKPTISLNAKLSQEAWLSLDISNVTVGQSSSPWAGLSLKQKF